MAEGVAEVDPGGQLYPALQLPEHEGTVIPDVAPYRPASHSPLHADVFMATIAPNRPATQFVHANCPSSLYVPEEHIEAVATMDPAEQAYPARHGPLQLDDISPEALPYRPGEHRPLQLALVKPATAPNRPGAQLVHDAAPLVLY